MKIFIATIGPYPDALHRALITREEKTKAQRDLATLKARPDKIDPIFNRKHAAERLLVTYIIGLAVIN